MRIRDLSELVDGKPLLPRALLGAMPTYSRVNPSTLTELLASAPGGKSLKYQPYSPGAAGTGDGRDRHSDRDHSRSGLARPITVAAMSSTRRVLLVGDPLA